MPRAQRDLWNGLYWTFWPHPTIPPSLLPSTPSPTFYISWKSWMSQKENFIDKWVSRIPRLKRYRCKFILATGVKQVCSPWHPIERKSYVAESYYEESHDRKLLTDVILNRHIDDSQPIAYWYRQHQSHCPNDSDDNLWRVLRWSSSQRI